MNTERQKHLERNVRNIVANEFSLEQGLATCGPWATSGPKIIFCGPLGADTLVRS